MNQRQKKQSNEPDELEEEDTDCYNFLVDTDRCMKKNLLHDEQPDPMDQN